MSKVKDRNKNEKKKTTIKLKSIVTLYSVRNSVSIRLNRLNSQDNSNAVSIGSEELNKITNHD